MAGNKFATMLQRNTHKLTVILVYAVLEWILIFLLLLNSLFTYLITKFAKYFGLKNPCPWCSRIDHMLEPGKNTYSCRDLVCERHAAEISKLGYCSNHQKLAETQNMCMDCLASRPNHSDQSAGMTRRIAFFTWVSKDAIENGENIVRCSCCNENINSNVYPPYLLFKPSWDSLKYCKKGDLIVGEMDDEKNGFVCKEISKPGILAHYADHEENNEIERDDGEGQQDREEAADEQKMLSDVGSFGLKDAVECSRSETNFQCDEKEAYIMERESYGMNSIYQGFDDSMIEYCFGKDNSIEIINLHSERNIDCDFNRLIPVELIDSSTTANYESWNLKEDLAEGIHQNGTTDSASHIEMNNEEKTSSAEVESVDIAMDCCEKSLVSNCTEMKKDSDSMERKQVMSLEEAQTLFLGGNNVDMVETKEPDEFPAHEEENNESNLLAEQTKSKDFVELSDFAINQPQAQESTISPFPQEDHSSVLDAPERNGFGPNNRETTTMEEKLVSADNNQEGINHDLSSHLESTETEEEKFPETPTSVESAHYLHKKLLLFEKRESGNEESLDGSVVSETDSGDPVLTIERLKTNLKAERKAFGALYTELEEERSASAIAANQTIAMINRLQEEKAAMQMEALQYQRMMEEQSEYDQEALQLLNELMIKREREKQDLEKELEVYRKKVLDYEAKEKLRMMRRIKNGSTRSTTSSATCSNAEDLDELSIDLNREAKDEDGSSSIENQEGGSNNTSSDGVINLQEIALDYVKQISALDDPLAEFEEERLSILDQLKALEEKLQNLDANEYSEDMHSEEQSSKYNTRGFDESFEMSTPEENGILNELSKIGDYPERKTLSSMAKNLLPLLDAAENETEEGFVFNENVESEFVGMENSLVPKFDLDGKKLAIEEEVDHVYERLQALEVDREFLKHCMSSMQMGDKGTNLLQEILKHLRDLRGVELRVRNTSEEPLE